MMVLTLIILVHKENCNNGYPPTCFFQWLWWVWRGPSTRSQRMWHVVEVCAIVYRPDGNILCPIDFAFDVSLSTSDDSAGELMYLKTPHTFHTTVYTIFNTVSPMDYTGVSLAILMFGACERRRCVNVTIENDVLENTESFDVTLERTTGLDGRITLDPVHVDGEIEITDNDGKLVSACQFTVI